MHHQNSASNSFQFAQIRDATTGIDRELTKILSHPANQLEFGPLLDELRAAGDHPRLTLAFAGEYSVGKSSLIKALTGMDVAIAADVTTHQLQRIAYGEHIDLLDMPGTLSGNLSHDQLARQAIAEADLLLFVLSNELFNAASLPVFRQIMSEFDKAGQTLLVVNQFDRISLRGRRPEEVIQRLSDELRARVAPHQLMDLGPVFVAARDYLDAQTCDDAATREQLTRESRLDSLRQAIDKFCLERGPAARLAGPLQLRLRLVADARSAADTGDEAFELELEMLGRKITIFSDAQATFQGEMRKLISELDAGIKREANDFYKLLEHPCGAAEVNAQWEATLAEVEKRDNETWEGLEELVKSTEARLADHLRKQDQSPLGAKLKAMRETKERDIKLRQQRRTPLESLASQKGDVLSKAGAKAGEYIAKNSEKAASTGANLYGKLHKYKPWEKIKLVGKLDNILKVSGKALRVAGVLAQIFFAWRDEEKKQKNEEARLAFKAEIRQALAEIAKERADEYRSAGKEAGDWLFGAELTQLHGQRQRLCQANEERDQLLRALDGLDKQLRHLLDRLKLPAA